MDKISDSILFDALKKAIEMQLDPDFIKILEMEVSRREYRTYDIYNIS